jgi:hypothetical protein
MNHFHNKQETQAYLKLFFAVRKIELKKLKHLRFIYALSNTMTDLPCTARATENIEFVEAVAKLRDHVLVKIASCDAAVQNIKQLASAIKSKDTSELNYKNFGSLALKFK